MIPVCLVLLWLLSGVIGTIYGVKEDLDKGIDFNVAYLILCLIGPIMGLILFFKYVPKGKARRQIIEVRENFGNCIDKILSIVILKGKR